MEETTGNVGLVLSDRYRLVALIGRGGMGSVWRAEHVSLGTPVAIKLVHPSVADQEGMLDRFLLEAKAAAVLRSVNVVHILDFGVHEGMPYIAMEHLEGESLAARLQRERRLGPAATAMVMAGVCRALAAAHRIGIVHRDLKPDNIFIARDASGPIVKVLDFGIAKIIEPPVNDRQETEAGTRLSWGSQKTKSGMILGTPMYMSPEQARGGVPLDGRSDLWSLAVIAFACLTGRLPFNAAFLGELIIQICAGPIIVPSSVAEVPRGFDAWFERATQRDRDARFQTAADFADALARILTPGQRWLDAGGEPESPASLPAPPDRRREDVPTQALGPDALTPILSHVGGDPEGSVDLPPPSAAGTNRICTVVLASAVPLGSSLDPSEIRELFYNYLQHVAELVRAEGGVTSRLGTDSMLCVFGADKATETDAERAVYATLRVQSSLHRASLPRWAKVMRGAARFGICTGRVFIEREENGSLTVTGEAVSMAARLQQHARPGTIVMGRETFRHVLSSFRVDSLPPIEMPGHPEPLAAYEVLGAVPFQHGLKQPDFCGVLTRRVGRAAEMGTLTSVLEEVVEARRSALITLVGPPGTGRSRLLAELFSYIAKSDVQFVVNVAEGSPLSMSTSHGVVASLLRRRFDIPEGTEPARILHLLRRGVRWLRRATARTLSFDDEIASMHAAPDDGLTGAPQTRTFGDELDIDDALARLAGLLDTRSALPQRGDAMTPDEQGAAARQRILAAAATLVRFAAARRPVVVLCDDAHWMDDSSLDLLNELVLRAGELPFLVVCTARPELDERRPRWGENNPAHRRIDLGPLDRRYIEEMIQDRLQHARDLSPDFVRQLAERADGSPRILDETMRLLVEAGVIEVSADGTEQVVHEARLGALSLPTTIQGLVQARLDRLDPEARDVLERAAVVGKTFWEGAVERLRPAGGSSTAEVIAGLHDRRLVRMRDVSTFPGEREQVFTESATHEVAYETLPARSRRRMHRRVARWLEARAPGSAQAALVALHYDRAGEPAHAAVHYARAATWAIALGENTEALRFLLRLRAIQDELGAELDGDEASLDGGALDGEEGPLVSWRDRVRVRLDLGDVQRRLGKLDEAEAVYEEARACIQAGDPDAPRWQARADFRLALLLKVRGDTGRAVEIAERAVACAREVGITDETPPMYALLAFLHRRERRHRESWQASLAGLHACRAIPRDDERRRENVTRALLGIAPVLFQKKRLVAAERTFLQAARIAEAGGDFDLLGRALNGLAATRTALGQHARARATYLQSLRAKEKAGDLHQIAILYSNVAELEIEMKELGAALSHARRGVQIAERIRAESDLAEMYRILSEAALGLDRPEEAIDTCLRALEIAQRVGRLYLDDVALTLAKATVRAAERAAEGAALRSRAEQGREALRGLLARGLVDGERRGRIESSLASVEERLA